MPPRSALRIEVNFAFRPVVEIQSVRFCAAKLKGGANGDHLSFRSLGRWDRPLIRGSQLSTQAGCDFSTRTAEPGLRPSKAVGRTGRLTNPPPQLGQRQSKRFDAHSSQNVHSKVQIKAPAASGARSRSQHSQLGRSSSNSSSCPGQRVSGSALETGLKRGNKAAASPTSAGGRCTGRPRQCRASQEPTPP